MIYLAAVERILATFAARIQSRSQISFGLRAQLLNADKVLVMPTIPPPLFPIPRCVLLINVSSRSPVLECSYGEIFIPVTEISVSKTEISITGPARPLVKFFTKDRVARSRKPSQPGWPGSYEEALRQWERDYLEKCDPERVSVFTFKWIAINFIERSPFEPKITAHMKHFSLLMRPFENNLFLCAWEYYEKINDVIHWPTRQTSLTFFKIRSM